jgi:K+-transporting ATPase ATPase C chain
MIAIRSQLRPALMALILLTVITGVIYPLTVTAIAQALFPWQANGSLLVRDGQPAGSALIGQPFDDPRYFWGRLSATTLFPYNAAASSGSNLGPANPALLDQVKARVAALKQADPANAAPVPADLATASGSGLDPDISPAAAEYQVPRVARARGLDEAVVRRLVAEATTGPTLGLLGESRVNVLELNMALDRLQPNR